MLYKVPLEKKHFSGYRRLVDSSLYQEVLGLASELSGKRVLHINSNPLRGGVAELLATSVPLLKDLGIRAEWHSIKNVPKNIYKLTKAVHNGLQGSPLNITAKQWHDLEAFNQKLAQGVDFSKWDYITVHDHQVIPLISFVNNRGSTKWLWRSHTDTTKPNPQYQKHIAEYLKPYDGAIFTAKEFVFKGLGQKPVLISPPAIDAFSQKNRFMSKQVAKRLIRQVNIDLKRPLITQVSRLDPWKDLAGVVKAWQKAAKKLPGLQLAILSNYSAADAQAKAILKDIKRQVGNHPDVHIVLNQRTPRLAKAFQKVSDVVLQKSIREGFGLTVTEAAWAKNPVIAGNVGGIKLQIKNGYNGYLINSIDECANRIVELIQNRQKRLRIGKIAHESVRKDFLMPRMLRDIMKFMLELNS